ncbi:SDR family NAD(P)-dependent oxidoreductase [Vallitalea guaymasensis]|uniref:SDR family NAD(P)-dependent oxidoreductase n=1 Tax=Vallitalea guaymasensis TaxID=1185412 RepID=UPI000DE36AEE|nr:SDR family NAD(P)-dependent oxidoreductase [Vallitalea guaymasensis]
MIDFIQYVLSEVKNARIDKSEAIDLIKQFKNQSLSHKENIFHPLIHENTSDLYEQSSSSEVKGEELVVLSPKWEERILPFENKRCEYKQRLVIFCEPNICNIDKLTVQEKYVEYLILQSEQDDIDERFQNYTLQIFKRIQEYICKDSTDKILIQIIVQDKAQQEIFSAFHALIKTAMLENPKITGQLIQLGEDTIDIADKLQKESRYNTGTRILYKNNKRFILDWDKVTASVKKQLPWKDRGVYIITGGAGALGFLFAKEIARNVKAPVIILVGSSSINESKQNKLNELEELGAIAEYSQVNVMEKESINKLICSTLEKYNTINGIIHSAGIIRDDYIMRKNSDEIKRVLAPKVTGLVNIDEATKKLPLDFFICFSSGVGVMGNIGQVDYSTANAFMDAYSYYRNKLVKDNKRHGQTLSINWPLWKDGGMHIDVETQKQITDNTGMVAMDSSVGVNALYEGLNSCSSQVLVFYGNDSKFRKYLIRDLHDESLSRDSTIDNNRSQLLIEKIQYKLKVLLGQIIKLKAEAIDSEEPLESYGIDSIMITKLNQKLADVFGDNLSKTLFYEYQTIYDLTEYLIKGYESKCITWTGIIESKPLTVNNTHEDVTKDKKTITPSLQKPKIEKNNRININNSNEDNFNKQQEPIAIIGVSGRYPKADKLEDYWNNLETGRDCITEIPEERWSIEDYYQEDISEAVSKGKSYSKWGGFIQGFADFDPLFFNISPREALYIDPQERLFIETCWEVIEDAGYTRERIAKEHDNQVGVFVGITKTGYDLYGPDLWSRGKNIYPHTSFGSVANRISYILNLKGPSIPIDTMCSSSLTAIHEACQHLRLGECEMAIAGGVNLYLHPSNYIQLSANNMLSSDGQCKSFGEGNNGFVPGEGVGAILLKPLSRAINDGDNIHAIIRGSSINHDGKTNGYTVPNPIAQGKVIKSALRKAGVNARLMSYIEAHGTGTKMGDPIEVTGLVHGFEKDTTDTGFCALGSVKSNIGHLEAAAGIAGITKIILQMKNEKIVPSIHAKKLNPNISFEKTPFVVQQELEEWKRPIVEIDGVTKEYPRIAGISSFGAGGANAHMIIEEYIHEHGKQAFNITTPNKPVMIVLSARKKEQLRKQAEQLIYAIEKSNYTNADLANIAYTLQLGREPMKERMGIIVKTCKELVEKLKDYLEGKDSIDVYEGEVKGNKNTINMFSTDQDLIGAIDSWIAKNKYGNILSFWVNGVYVDFNKLYDEKPHIISLPTYPFARERYWIADMNNNDKKYNDNKDTASYMKKQGIKQADNHYVNTSIIKELNAKCILKPVNEAITNDKKQMKIQEKIQLSSINNVTHKENRVYQKIRSKDLSPTDNNSHFITKKLQSELINSLAEILEMNQEDIDMDTQFIDIGLDSIISVEWVKVINKKYGTTIKATRVYDYPTLREFVDYIAANIHIEDNNAENEQNSKQCKNISFSNSMKTKEETDSYYYSIEALTEELADSLAKVLAMQTIDIDKETQFIDMGLDSIIGVEWVKIINKKYDTSIKATKLYDYPTISEFAEFMLQIVNNKENTLNVQETINNIKAPSLEQIISEVKKGELNINQAEQLFHQLS